jgi:cellulose synthase/poly-beta-1,6-N-acetylglucosamine synthase-like glycosyltransferase
VLIDIQPNKGKTEGQNVAFDKATGDILVFSDANAIYDQDAIKYLVASFKDENIGCVVGQLKYINPHNSISGKSEGAYWKYEKKIKELESKCGSLMGANGSIYAVRKDLFVKLPPDIISDFVEPLRILMQNKWVIYQPKAISRELSSENMQDEFARKVRIALRSFRGLIYCRQLLNVIKYPEYAFKLVSHKMLRWLVPVFMIIVFVTNILLVPIAYYYSVLLIGQVLFYLLSYIGCKSNSRFLLLYIPYYFVAVNLAMLIALIKLLKGEKATSWNPIR